MSKKLYVIKQVRGRQIREGRVVMPGTTYETFDAEHKDPRFCNQLEKIDEKTVSDSYVLAKLDGVIVDAGMEGKDSKKLPVEDESELEEEETTAQEEEINEDQDEDENEDEEIKEVVKKEPKKKSVLKPLSKKKK